MRVDWIVGVVTFLMFIVWAFSYYSLASTGRMESRTDAALLAADGIADYLKADFVSTPANLTSPSAAQDAVLWAYVNWTGDSANTTRIVTERMSNESAGCMVSGNIVYWSANISAGQNVFFIERADMAAPMACSDTLPTGGANQTTLWAGEPSRTFSSQRNALVCGLLSSDYAGTKAGMGSAFDVNILIERGGSQTECGPALPVSRDIFSFPYTGPLFEGGEVNVTVRLWQ
jgi:hypothetical protein